MGTAQIVMLIIGLIVIAASFVLPEMLKGQNLENKKEEQEEIRKLIAKELEGVQAKVDGVVDESIQYAMEKTERSLERLSNEKIMAVSEYSETVLEDINKTHKEVMFLHDMLADKQDELKNAVTDMEKEVSQIKQDVTDHRLTVEDLSKSLEQSKLESEALMQEVKTSMQQAQEVASNIEAEASKRAQEREQALLLEIEEVAKHKNELLEDSQSIEQAKEEAQEAIRKVQEEVLKLSNEKAEAMKAVEEAKRMKEMAAFTEAKVSESTEAISHLTETAEREAQYDDSFTKLNFETVQVPEELPKEEVKKAKETKEVSFKSDVSTDLSFMPSDHKNKNSNERILELHKAGKSNMAIAKELGLGIGEVKLVIDLFKG